MLALLTGKTHKGKSIVLAHGNTWDILRWSKGQVLVKSGRDMRWIDMKSDKDFDITLPQCVLDDIRLSNG